MSQFHAISTTVLMSCIYISYYQYVDVLSARVEVREGYFYKCCDELLYSY